MNEQRKIVAFEKPERNPLWPLLVVFVGLSGSLIWTSWLVYELTRFIIY